MWPEKKNMLVVVGLHYILSTNKRNVSFTPHVVLSYTSYCTPVHGFYPATHILMFFIMWENIRFPPQKWTLASWSARLWNPAVSPVGLLTVLSAGHHSWEYLSGQQKTVRLPCLVLSSVVLPLFHHLSKLWSQFCSLSFQHKTQFVKFIAFHAVGHALLRVLVT